MTCYSNIRAANLMLDSDGTAKLVGFYQAVSMLSEGRLRRTVYVCKSAWWEFREMRLLVRNSLAILNGWRRRCSARRRPPTSAWTSIVLAWRPWSCSSARTRSRAGRHWRYSCAKCSTRCPIGRRHRVVSSACAIAAWSRTPWKGSKCRF